MKINKSNSKRLKIIKKKENNFKSMKIIFKKIKNN